MVSVPVVSVNGMSSVTVTAPSMIISSVPAGDTPSLQFDPTDQTPVVPPTQVTGGGATVNRYADPTLIPLIPSLTLPISTSLFDNETAPRFPKKSLVFGEGLLKELNRDPSVMSKR